MLRTKRNMASRSGKNWRGDKRMRTEEQINESLKFYMKIRDKAQKGRRFRTVEGAQWNIDKCMDELYKLQKDKTT